MTDLVKSIRPGKTHQLDGQGICKVFGGFNLSRCCWPTESPSQIRLKAKVRDAAHYDREREIRAQPFYHKNRWIESHKMPQMDRKPQYASGCVEISHVIITLI